VILDEAQHLMTIGNRVSNTWYNEQENKGRTESERYWNPWESSANSTRRSSN
jgi:hypothetical protein